MASLDDFEGLEFAPSLADSMAKSWAVFVALGANAYTARAGAL